MAVWNIPAHTPFLPSLADGLLQKTFGDYAPEDWTIFLPTRRAVRGLEEALYRAKQSPLLLPSLHTLADSDEALLAFSDLSDAMLALPPALTNEQRELAVLNLVWQQGRELVPTQWQAGLLGRDLLRLLDDSYMHGIDLQQLSTLVEGDFAEHWQKTLALLDLIIKQWPSELQKRKRLDPAQRRDKIFELQRHYWQTAKGPVMVAGSTASLPAVRAFITSIAKRPDGVVVLPALDKAAFATDAPQEPTHSQYMLGQLLSALALAPADVRDWECAPAKPAKPRLVVGANLREEAGAIAWLMRETLQSPDKTVALVTPDRTLARAVAASLLRWDIVVDDSAMQTLAESGLGRITRLLLAALEGQEFVPLLALLQSPLLCLGYSRAEMWENVRLLETAVLHEAPEGATRAERIRKGIAKLEDEKTKALLEEFFTRLTNALKPLQDLCAKPATLEVWHTALQEVMQALLADTENKERLTRQAEFLVWQDCLSRYAQAGEGQKFSFTDWNALLAQWLGAVSFQRPRANTHPRAFIWGVLEARLQRTDRLIVGGLNEGSFPPAIHIGAWLSRPMRAKMQFPALEQRIGQSAHDFMSLAASCDDVVFTRARKSGENVTIESRWLTEWKSAGKITLDPAPVRLWAQLDEATLAPPEPRPQPAPPVALRPVQLSVTQVQRLQDNPYAIYAQKILQLTAQPALDSALDMLMRGSLLHRVLEVFQKTYPPAKALPKDIPAALLECADEVKNETAGGAQIIAYWQPRLRVIGEWLNYYENRLRANGLRQVLTEEKGNWTFAVATAKGKTNFTLTAKADRINVFADGRVEIVDYKTGAIPTLGAMQKFKSLQLPLTALIALNGGFAKLPQVAESQITLTHLQIAGDNKARIEQAFLAADVDLSAQQKALFALLAGYTDKSKAYEWEAGKNDFSAGEYAPLARVQEWQGQENG